MAKPTSIYVFDTTKTHLVPTTSGHQSIGFVTNEKPGSGEINYILNAHGEWIAFLDSDATVHEFPDPFLITANWAPNETTPSPGPSLTSTGAGTAWCQFRLAVGRRLKSVTFALWGNASADLTTTITRTYKDGTANADGAVLTNTNPAAAWIDVTVNYELHAGPQVLSANAAASVFNGSTKMYTRTTGSWITDGYAIGQTISASGFANAGNNGAFVIVGIKSATELYVTSGSMVTETGSGDEDIFAIGPVVDASSSIQIKFAASAIGLAIKDLRYTFDNPT